MERVWRLTEIPEEALKALENTGFPEVFLRILYNRGIRDEESIERYFSPRSRFLGSPYMLSGINKAVERIFKAVETEEGIRVYGDRDVDGITSTVLLSETLKNLTPKVDYTVPIIEDGYGLNPLYLDKAVSDGVSLIVTVDCGISNLEEVEYARKNNIDVIITDHHEPPNKLPEAVAIVDPKIKSVYSHQDDIAGVGVALKLSMALELARTKQLSIPIIAFDYSENSINAVRFHPKEGIKAVRDLSASSLSGCRLLFFNETEKKEIGEMMPDVLKETGSGNQFLPIFLDKVMNACIPEEISLAKDSALNEMGLDKVKGAERVLFAFLKCVEARAPEIKALWKRSLDILSIGTIADMVPLKGENRIFTQMGLKFVSKTKRIGLNNLFNIIGWKNKIVSEKDISFNIAPILNSSGRLKTAELAIELLTTDFPPKAKMLSSELYDLNNERKRLGEDCYQKVKSYLIEQNDLENDKVFMVAAPLKNQGVTGIVATRLMLDYCKPVIVLLEDQGKFLGSARSFNDINIIAILNHCSEALEKFGGHIGAAGLTMSLDKVDEFRAKLREYADNNISEDDLQAEWKIDSELDIERVNEQFLEDILRFSPFGIENPAPLFMAKNVPFHEIKKVGETKGHLRFRFKKSSGRNLFGIGFNLGDLMVPDVIRDGTCDIVFNVEPNDFNGMRSAQLMICDCKIRGFK